VEWSVIFDCSPLSVFRLYELATCESQWPFGL